MKSQTQFQAIKVVGLNEKAVEQLRTYATKDLEERTDLIVLDLSAAPDNFFRVILASKWSSLLHREAVAAGGIRPVPPFNGDLGSQKSRETDIAQSEEIARAIHNPNIAKNPAFRGATVCWNARCVGLFGGLASYTRRVLKILEETNNAYPNDSRVLAREDAERKQAAVEEARRAEIEGYIKQVSDVLAAQEQDAVKAA